MNLDTNGEPKATNEQSKVIKPILSDTVHQICSGQVVLSLAVAVKELVENSLDAEASLIEIKLHNQGLDSVEVSDNGRGVQEHNISALTAKYHTSKLKEFSDLLCVETFGFRGEALSSLCALSDMTISTRHSSTDIGTRIELAHDGSIKKKTRCARQVGTTVQISNLFSTLPVRKREFARNIKKEFSKMCQVLQGYGLISRKVRIICWNTSPKGTKTTVLSTHGSQNYIENIHAIFGAKQVADIVELKSPFEENLTLESLVDLNETDSSFQITEDDIAALNSKQFHLEGWISSCEHGKGRGSKDRQFFFVNSRPCEPKNVAKVVNQIYHRYNLQQCPFVFLNVVMNRSGVDVNLTPDKRQLLISNEKILLLAIKKALLKTFGSIPSTYKLQNTTIDSLYSSQLETTDQVDSDDEVKVKPDACKFISVLSQWKATGDIDTTIKPVTNTKRKMRNSPTEIMVRTAKMKKIQEILASGQDSIRQQNDSLAKYTSESEEEGEISILDTNKLKAQANEFDHLVEPEEMDKEDQVVERITCKTIPTPRLQSYELNPLEICDSRKDSARVEEDGEPLDVERQGIVKEEKEESKYNPELERNPPKKRIVLDSSDDESDVSQVHHEVTTSLNEIREALRNDLELKAKTKESLQRLRFKSRIDPSQNNSAEKELELEISKDMFAKMEIIGQFNLGFIVVLLDADLFIIDQHATDEKYNFEQLQNTTTLQYQPLTVPQTLEMTTDCEMVLIDNLDVFEKNGFKFGIDENAPPTKKVKLLGKPFSKNWEFGKDDIDELIFMLRDAPKGSLCRPSRIRAMFASRACRKSIMIGTALNEPTMRTLVNHMGEIDHPWNCPHGRPTMRHLVNIDLLSLEDDDDESSNSEDETSDQP